MSLCCCSLAGTATCRYYSNNPNAEPSQHRTYITTNYTIESQDVFPDDYEDYYIEIHFKRRNKDESRMD